MPTARSTGILFGTLCALIWGGQAVVTRVSIFDELTPADVTMLRFSIAGLTLMPVILARWSIVGPLGWGRAAVLAMLAGAPYSFVLVAGASFAPALHSAVVAQGLTPAAAMLLGFTIEARRPGNRRLFGSALIIVGVFLFVWSGDASNVDIAGPIWRGDALFALAAFMWAAYGYLCKRWRVAAMDATLIVCILSLPVLPLVLIMPSNVLRATIGAILLQAAYLGVLVGVVSLWLYTRCVALLGPVDAALFLPLVPIATGFVGGFALGEWPSFPESLATAITVTGMILALRRSENSGPDQSTG